MTIDFDLSWIEPQDSKGIDAFVEHLSGTQPPAAPVGELAMQELREAQARERAMTPGQRVHAALAVQRQANGVPRRGMRVATLNDLAEFQRVGTETLIHRSTQDLWSFESNADGTYAIRRLFDDTNGPLKG